MLKTRLAASLILLAGAGIGFFVYYTQATGSWPFLLSLDLNPAGGTRLTYSIDTSKTPPSEVSDSIAALRDTIERRVNLFGVSEPIVQTETGGAFAGKPEERLLVELPGVTDTQKAVQLIGQTPVLEFRLLKAGETPPPTGQSADKIGDLFEPAVITGRNVQSAALQFVSQTGALNEPVVVVHLDAAGSSASADMFKNDVGRYLGIFLDGVLINEPVIQTTPLGADTSAVQITNLPDANAAKDLARNLNYGALPMPITLESTESVSSLLGSQATVQGLAAGIFGIGAVMLFMLAWYRLPGLIADLALLIYIAAMLALFKIIGVSISAAGMAGFILSAGMAVDANILIFERMKEEIWSGKPTTDAMREGFSRAWPSIRDSNISSMITALILYWLGTAEQVRGFALVFGIGVLVSMLTAISVSRTFLLALGISAKGGFTRFLFSSGISGGSAAGTHN